MKLFTRGLLIVTLLTPFAVSADDTPSASKDKPAETTGEIKPKQTKLTANELEVLAHYHAVNLMEMELGKLAAKRATSQAVKAYGEMLVKDHGDDDKKLIAFAKKTGQKIPKHKPPTEAERKEHADAKLAAAKLKKLTGSQFTAEYLRMMVDGHERELANIDSRISQVQNTELADMLKAKKQVLQHHADAARELQKTDAQASR